MLMLLLSLINLAKAEDSVFVGGSIARSTGNFYSLALASTSQFNQTDSFYGYGRYGYGKGEFNIGNGFGFAATSTSGLVMLGAKPGESKLSPMLGLELGGRLVLNTNYDVKSYYQWFPGVSYGVEVQAQNDRLIFAGKSGIAAGNFERTDLLPNFNPYYGVGAYFNSKLINIGLDYLKFSDNLLLASDLLINIDNVSFGLRAESLTNNTLNLQDQRVSLIMSIK